MAHATGTVQDVNGAAHLVFVRELNHPIDEVWSSIVDSDRLDAWIGRWEGDPADGTVQFWMTAEGQEDPETVTITRCEPPHRLAVVTSVGDESWTLSIDLAANGDTTTLTFAMLIGPSDDVSMVGPGWDYYLDRHAASLADDDTAIVWDDYFPAFQEYYSGLGAQE